MGRGNLMQREAGVLEGQQIDVLTDSGALRQAPILRIVQIEYDLPADMERMSQFGDIIDAYSLWALGKFHRRFHALFMKSGRSVSNTNNGRRTTHKSGCDCGRAKGRRTGRPFL